MTTDPTPADCKHLEHAVVLRTRHAWSAVLTPDEAEMLATQLLAAASLARDYKEPKKGPFGRRWPKRKTQLTKGG